MSVFSNQLVKWYLLNLRQLPWRETRDPYKIWVSEVILQQTRVAQGLAYYERFIKEFPKITDLARADQAEVLKLWQGLGYYSRARNMHHTAQEVVRLYKGKFPSYYDKLILLKGIGDYTASAISSFVNNEPHPVIDGNVMRVLSRYFGINVAIDSTEGKKIMKEKALSIFDSKNAGMHNQAIMEFGALVCTPKKSLCEECIFKKSCVAYHTGKVDSLPLKKNKVAVKKRFFHYSVIHDRKNIFLKKRVEKDIWEALFDFPMIESNSIKIKWDSLINSSIAKKNKLKGKPDYTVQKTHKLSHQELLISFHVFEVEKMIPDKTVSLIPLNKKRLPGVPQVVLRFLEGEKLI